MIKRIFKKLVQWVFTAVLMAACVAGLVWYQHETGIPQQILDQLRVYWDSETYSPEDCFEIIMRAQQQRDSAAFRRHVDLDAIAEDLAESFKTGWALPAYIFDGAPGVPTQTVAAAIRQNLIEAIETGEATRRWLLTPPVPAEIEEEKTWDMASLTVEAPTGKICFATMTLGFAGLERHAVVRYRLRDTGENWQIARIDLDQYSKDIEDLRLESVGLQNIAIEQINVEVSSHIEQTLRVAAITHSTIHRYLARNSVVFTVEVENMGDPEIVRYSGLLLCSNRASQELIQEIPFRIRTSIASGEISKDNFEVPVGFFDSQMKQIYRMTQEELAIEIEVQSIIFADGAELKYRDKIVIQ